MGLRKIGRFQYEPKRGIRNAVKVVSGMMVQNKMLMKVLHLGPVKGWEYLIKFSEGRQWGNEYLNQEYWLRYIGDWGYD